MISSGIIRRIDDLGRIVIPKEIRKKLHIKTGDNLEILIDGDSIILKKYSFVENISDIIDSYTKAFNNVLNYNVFITDTDKIISVAGNLKNKYNNLSISSFVEKLIERREKIVTSKKSSIELSSGIFEDAFYITSPIICNGDAFGAVIIVSLNTPFLPGEDKMANILADILSNYFI